MNTLQVKVYLLKNGLTLQQIAEELCEEGKSIDAYRVMLSHIVNGKRYYPSIAAKVRERYGFNLPKPAAIEIRRAA